MIVPIRDGLRMARPYPQRAGHAKMDQQITLAAFDIQVFAAAPDILDNFACHQQTQLRRNWPAQPGSAYNDPINALCNQTRCNPISDHFDFWQFRHELNLSISLPAYLDVAQAQQYEFFIQEPATTESV